MSQTKYTGKALTMSWTGTTPTVALTQIEAKSKSLNIDTKGKEIDVTTQEDAVSNNTAYLSGPSERTAKIAFLDSQTAALSLDNLFHVTDQGTLIVMPQGTGTGLPTITYTLCSVTGKKIDYPTNGEGATAGEIDIRLGAEARTVQS